MNRSIRKLVGGGAAALALGGFFALIVAPHVAGAGVSYKVLPGTAVSTATLKASALARIPVAKATTPKVTIRVATPSASCTAAKDALAAAVAKDKAEDAAEKAGTGANDAAEDAAEKAAIKPLVEAAFNACASPACVSAANALKAAREADQAEDAAEKAAGTEGTAADAAEDAAEKAKLAPLWKAVMTDCAFGIRGATTHKTIGTHTFGAGTRGTFTWSSWTGRR